MRRIVCFTFGAMLWAESAWTAEPASLSRKPNVTTAMDSQKMADEQFWLIVNESASLEADPEQQLALISKALAKLSEAETVAFDEAYRRQMKRAYTWDLWGAAYVAHGGASDDGFEYFRSWLVSKGSQVFNSVVEDPDVLADLLAADLEGVLEFEDFGYVAMDSWAKKSGKSIEEFPVSSSSITFGEEPMGERFDESEEHLSKRFPKLWERFGKSPLG